MVAIELVGIELYGFHGVLPQERRDGQRFLIDLELTYRDCVAARSDRIRDAVDYREVIETVRAASDARTYHLLEAFAATLADVLLTTYPLGRVRVRVCKPEVVLDTPVEHAAVIVERVAGAGLDVSGSST